MSEFIDKFQKEQGKEFSPDLIGKYSRILCKNYSEYIAEWWNPEKYNWHYSMYLAKYCSSDFNVWWDPEEFNWINSSYLIENCSSDILVWFDKEKIDYTLLDPCAIVLLKKHGKLGE